MRLGGLVLVGLQASAALHETHDCECDCAPEGNGRPDARCGHCTVVPTWVKNGYQHCDCYRNQNGGNRQDLRPSRGYVKIFI